MSIATELTNYQTYLTNAYNKCSDKGATIPANRNLQNLTSCIDTISGGGKTQVINYTMLYDGTLGESGSSGANVCTSITGGWELLINSGNGTLTFNNNSMSVTLASTYGDKNVAPFTSNSVSLTGYTQVVSINLFNYVPTGYLSSGTNIRSAKIYGAGSTNVATTLDLLNDTTAIANKKMISRANDFTANSGYPYLGTYGNNYTRYIYAVALLKQDDWQTLCTVAGLTSSDYTDEDDMCSNSSAISTILASETAINYMVHNCTGTFMIAFLHSATATTLLANSSNKWLIYLNEHWRKFLGLMDLITTT